MHVESHFFFYQTKIISCQAFKIKTLFYDTITDECLIIITLVQRKCHTFPLILSKYNFDNTSSIPIISNFLSYNIFFSITYISHHLFSQ